MGRVKWRKLPTVYVLETLVESVQTQVSAGKVNVKLRPLRLGSVLYQSQQSGAPRQNDFVCVDFLCAGIRVV